MLISRDTLDQIYTILVEAGANEVERADFIDAYSGDVRSENEWRFQGRLGFGGKFRAVLTPKLRYIVTYYLEDKTSEREAIVAAVNEKLSKL